MSDLADIAAEHIERVTEIHLARRVRFEGVSLTHCRDCDAEIPPRRRELLPGVALCVDCQRIEERT
jgi:phage/conjugal plasmid C-4 type zinc finger TraR family protein